MKTVASGSQGAKMTVGKKNPKKREVAIFSRAEVEKSNKRMTLQEDIDLKKERSPSRMRERGPQLPQDMRMRGLIRSHKKKRERGLQRKKKYAVRLRASRGEKSLLEAASVKAPQRKDYSRRLEQFYAFVLRYELPIQNENQLDEALCEFADHLFLDGEGLSFGQKLQAAIEYERPEFAQEGRLALPRFKRAMKGWRRLNPQQTRLPMPEFLKSAISAVMVQKGWLEEALFNQTTFSTYARPGETLRIFAADIVEKNADFDHTVIVLGPLERGESSKVGIYDETLVLDDSRAPWLGMLLVRLAKQKLQRHGEEAELWDFKADAYPGQVERSSFIAGHSKDCAEPIPESSWRSQSRSHDEVASHPKHSAEGQVGNRLQHKGVRQARTHAADCESVWRQFQRARQRDAASLRYLLPEWHKSTTSASEEATQPDLRGEVLLSLFGGVGECCRFVSRHGGDAILIDFASSKQNDLGRPSRWQDVLSLAAFATIVGIDLPCNTWSRARRAPWWSKMPSPLRGDNPSDIFGLSGLKKSDFGKVQAANHMVRGALRLIRFCLKKGIPGYLENPLTSRLWKVPAIQQLLAQRKAFFIRADMCQYNTQWRKPTGLLIWHCSSFSMKTCWQKAKCKRTAKPHLQLTGAINGKFLTHQAQVHTKEFTHHKYPPLSHL